MIAIAVVPAGRRQSDRAAEVFRNVLPENSLTHYRVFLHLPITSYGRPME